MGYKAAMIKRQLFARCCLYQSCCCSCKAKAFTKLKQKNSSAQAELSFTTNTTSLALTASNAAKARHYRQSNNLLLHTSLSEPGRLLEPAAGRALISKRPAYVPWLLSCTTCGSCVLLRLLACCCCCCCCSDGGGIAEPTRASLPAAASGMAAAVAAMRAERVRRLAGCQGLLHSCVCLRATAWQAAAGGLQQQQQQQQQHIPEDWTKFLML
jgi:hypothetical protein